MTEHCVGEGGPALLPSGGRARIAYEATIEERVAAQIRLYEVSGLMKRQRWLPLVLAPIGAGACYLVSPGPPGLRISAALFFAVVYSGIHLLIYRTELKRQIRKLLARQLKTTAPIPSEYEISDKGIVFRQLGMEVGFDWRAVEGIEEVDDAIEFVVSPAGISRVPVRIFRDAAERSSWLEYARAHQAEARR
jgi:hypothetical protein